MRIIIAILILLSMPPMLFAGEGRRAFQPDWEWDFRHDLRTKRTISGNDPGDGSLTRAGIAYGWVKESVVAQGTVTPADSRCSFGGVGYRWLAIDGEDFSAQASARNKVTLIDGDNRQAKAQMTSTVGSGEAWNNVYASDFSGGVDSWEETYHIALLGNQDGVSDGSTSKDDCLKATLDDQSNAHGARQKDAMTAYKRYRESITYYIPATNSHCDGFVIGHTDVDESPLDRKSTGSDPAVVGTWDTTSNYEFLSLGSHTGLFMTDGGTHVFQDAGGDDVIYLSEYTLDEQTDCASTGVHTGAWTVETGFDYNDIVAYIITTPDNDGDLLGFFGNNEARHHAEDGLLLEPEGTNKLLYCRDLSQVGSWTGDLTSKTQNETGIDGVANKAWTLVDTDADKVYILQALDVPDDSNPTIASCFIKATSGATTFPGLTANYVSGTTEVTQMFAFNTNTGAIVDRSGFPTDYSGSQRIGDWWKVWIGADNNSSGNTSFRLYLRPAVETDMDGTWENAIEGSCIVDWIQVELNKKFPSSPIYTEASEVTRIADSDCKWTLPSNMFAESLDSDLIICGDVECADPVGNGYWTGFSVPADSGVTNAQANSGTTSFYYIDDGTLSGANTRTFTTTIGHVYKLSFSVYPDDTTAIYVGVRTGVGGADDITRGFLGLNQDAWNDVTLYFAANSTGSGSYVKFYTYGNGDTYYIDDVSVEEVTKAWDGMPPHGTMVVWWEPGYDADDHSTTNSGLIGCQESANSLIITDSDATNRFKSVCEDCSSLKSGPDDYEVGDTLKLVLKWGYLEDNVAYYSLGYDDGDGLTYTLATSNAPYSGKFTTGTDLILGYGLFGPMKIKKVQLYRRILTDGEINALEGCRGWSP